MSKLAHESNKFGHSIQDVLLEIVQADPRRLNCTATFNTVIDSSVSAIRFNCRKLLLIKECKINGQSCSFSFHDNADVREMNYNDNLRAPGCLQRFIIERAELFETGELMICLPEAGGYQNNDEKNSTVAITYSVGKASQFEKIYTMANDFIGIHQWSTRYTYSINFSLLAGYTVYCTGENNIDHHHNTYKITQPIQAEHVGFVLIADEFAWNTIKTEGLHQLKIHYSKNRTEQVENLMKLLQLDDILWRLEEKIDYNFPFDQLQVVFSDSMHDDDDDGLVELGNLLICSDDLLFSKREALEQVYTTSSKIVRAIVSSWLSSQLHIQTPPDQWIVHGMIRCLEMYLRQLIFGRVYVEFEHLKQVDKLNRNLDQALYCTVYRYPRELNTNERKIRAGIVMKHLYSMLGDEVMTQIFRELISLTHVDPDLSTTANINTFQFRAMILKHCHVSPTIQEFFRRYVYNADFPTATFQYSYDSRKKVTHVEMAQCPQEPWCALTLNVNEVNKSYDHHQILDGTHSKFDLLCHSSVLRNRKRKTFELAELITLPVDKLLARNNETPMSYIRFDYYNTLLCVPVIHTTMMMLLQQVNNEKQLKGQYEALKGLKLMLRKTNPDLNTTNVDKLAAREISTNPQLYEVEPDDPELDDIQLCAYTLKDILMSAKTYYWEIRAEALFVLAENCGTYKLFRSILFQYFNNLYVSRGDTTLLLSNNFQSSLEDYFLKCHFIRSIALAIDPQTSETHEEVVKFLLYIVENRDNTGNNFDDDRYKCVLYESLGNIKLKQGSSLFVTYSLRIVSELRRVFYYDQIISSPQQCVSAAALNSLNQWKLRFPRYDEEFKLKHECPISKIFHYLENESTSYLLKKTCWKCALSLLKVDYTSYLTKILRFLVKKKNTTNSLKSKLLKIWYRQYRCGKLDIAWSHTNNELNREFMTYLWNTTLETSNLELQYQCEQLYNILWGDRSKFSNFMNKFEWGAVMSCYSMFDDRHTSGTETTESAVFKRCRESLSMD